MTTVTHHAGAPLASRWIPMLGIGLGIAAGFTQLLFGSMIPQWSGNKLDPTGLGITTIILTLVAGMGLWQLQRTQSRVERLVVFTVVLACAAVCFTTVGRLWYLPGPLIVAAALMALASGSSDVEQRHEYVADESHAAPRAGGGLGGWLLYAGAVVVGLVVVLSSLLTVLLGRGWASVAAAALVSLAAGLAVSGWIAPWLSRRLPAMIAGGFGAGLMAGGLVLGAISVLIATG